MFFAPFAVDCPLAKQTFLWANSVTSVTIGDFDYIIFDFIASVRLHKPLAAGVLFSLSLKEHKSDLA